MKTKIFLIIVYSIFISTNSMGQIELEHNFILSQFYHNEGNITLEHKNDGYGNGFKNTFLQIHAPFYASAVQTLAIESKLQKKSISGDRELKANLGLGWQLNLFESWNLIAGINGNFSQFEVNKAIQVGNSADALLQYKQFNSFGLNTSLGILHKYFWTIALFEKYFVPDNQYLNYENQKLDVTLGFEFDYQNWEFRLPVQAFDLINFDQNQLYAGFLVAFKQNYIYMRSNLQNKLSFELGLRPYSWLSLGIIYEPNNLTTNYGVYGAYEWKPQKLNL